MNWPKPMPQENCHDECQRDSQPNISRIFHKRNLLYESQPLIAGRSHTNFKAIECIIKQYMRLPMMQQ